MKREILFEKLKTEAETTSINGLAKRLEIPFPTLHRILHGTVKQGRVETWDKIEAYFRRNKSKR